MSVVGQIAPFTEDEWTIFQNAFHLKTVPKNTVLIREGTVSKEMFFVNKGLLRLYYINRSGDEITAFLFNENLFASCYESFLTQTPSIQQLETLEESELLTISFEQLQVLYKTLPQINIISRVIADQRFINGQQILSSFILQTPFERYQNFLEKQPGLLLRVPLQYIASFLGITPVSLSRIRKRIASSK